MVCQHYRRRLYLSQVCSTRKLIKGCPFPPGGGRLGWGGEGEGVCPYRLSAVGLSLLAALLVTLALSGTSYGDDELVRYRIIDGTIPEPLTAQPGDPER